MNRLKMGVLGVSAHFIKRVILPLSDSDLVLSHAIASRSKKKAQIAAEKYGIPLFYGSYEALLKDKSVNFIYISLPNHMHAEYIKKSADAGKHILCEKPLAMDAAQAEEAVRYAAEKNILLAEAFMYKYHPQWRHVRDLVHTGEIGEINLVNTFFGYNNTDPKNIRNIKSVGGGGLMDIGCYAVSVPRFLLGREPERVCSLITYDRIFQTDILSSAILDFGKARAAFTVATQTYPHQKVEIHGTRGIMTVEIPFNTFGDVPSAVTISTPVGERRFLTEPVNHYRVLFDEFSKLIQGEEAVSFPPEDAVNNMKVIDALIQSDKTRSWVNL